MIKKALITLLSVFALTAQAIEMGQVLSDGTNLLSLASSAQGTADTADSKADVNATAIITSDGRILNNQISLLQNWIMDAYNNDMSDIPADNAQIYNMDTLSGINTGASQNITIDASGDFITNVVYEAASGASELLHFKCNDNAATTNVVNDGTVNGGTYGFTEGELTSAKSAAGKINTPLNFTRGDLVFGNVDSASLNSPTGFLSMWVNPDTTDFNTVFGIGKDSERGFYLGYDKDAPLSGSAGANGGFQTINDLDVAVVGEWVWFCISQGGEGGQGFTGQNLWTNNVRVTGTDATFTTQWLASVVNRDGVLIGARFWDRNAPWQFDGQVDDIRLYDIVPTQTQMDFLYNSGSGTEAPLSVPESGGDMTVVSSNRIFTTDYQDVNIRILHEDGIAFTNNVNYKFWLSNDGGVTSNQVTLVESFESTPGSGMTWLTGTNYFSSSDSNFVCTLYSAQDAGRTYSFGYTVAK